MRQIERERGRHDRDGDSGFSKGSGEEEEEEEEEEKRRQERTKEWRRWRGTEKVRWWLGWEAWRKKGGNEEEASWTEPFSPFVSVSVSAASSFSFSVASPLSSSAHLLFPGEIAARGLQLVPVVSSSSHRRVFVVLPSSSCCQWKFLNVKEPQQNVTLIVRSIGYGSHKSHATVTAGVTLTGRRYYYTFFILLYWLRNMKVFNINEATLSLALYTDVTNSKELLESMQAGTLEPEVAFLNALLIPDVFPLLAAAHKTLVAKSRDSLTTRTLHSELVYNYSGSKHISESLKRCGISDNTTYILAARFDATPDEIKAIEKLINGKEIELEELEGRANQSQIQKHYKLSAPELGVSSLADAITCRIASRDAL
ncbi:hypothetical protein HN873_026782 [Arachis hypogaea]